MRLDHYKEFRIEAQWRHYRNLTGLTRANAFHTARVDAGHDQSRFRKDMSGFIHPLLQKNPFRGGNLWSNSPTKCRINV